MILEEKEIIRSLKIGPKTKVLDIGGSMMQHVGIKVDTIVDIIAPEESSYTPSRLLAKHFVKLDVTRDRLPFPDQEFDVCLCTHTLEDLPTPFLAIEEMQRVAKRGLIVTPSMGRDMTFGHIDFTDWLTGARRVPGEGHHKWFFVKTAGGLRILPKVYPVLYTPQFQVVEWRGDEEMVFFWDGKIKYAEVSGLNIHRLIDEYKMFIDKNKKLIKIGTTAIFVDNPFNWAKAAFKKLLKRGNGYSFRKVL